MAAESNTQNHNQKFNSIEKLNSVYYTIAFFNKVKYSSCQIKEAKLQFARQM